MRKVCGHGQFGCAGRHHGFGGSRRHGFEAGFAMRKVWGHGQCMGAQPIGKFGGCGRFMRFGRGGRFGCHGCRRFGRFGFGFGFPPCRPSHQAPAFRHFVPYPPPAYASHSFFHRPHC
jgi:hypothetical protein